MRSALTITRRATFGAGAAITAVLVLASPRPVAAQAALPCNASGPTYMPRGDHWIPEPGISVEYRISNQSVQGLSASTAANAIQSAMDTWMGVRCDSQYSCSDVTCDGANHPIPYVRMVRGADYPGRNTGDDIIYGTGLPFQVNAANNVIFFVPTGWNTATGADANTLAITLNSYIPSTGAIVTADMVFNDENFNWRVGGSGCTVSNSCYDVERVALHEFGHFFGLHHVSCAGAIMYFSGSSDDERHTLTENEKEGMCRVYPPTPLTAKINCGLGDGNAGCRAFAESCDNVNECQEPAPGSPSGVSPLCVEDGYFKGYRYCTFACDTTSDCPTGYTCGQTIPELKSSMTGELPGVGKFCMPGPNFSGSDIITGGGCSCNTSLQCDNDANNSCTCDPDCLVGGGGGGTGNATVCSPCSTGSQCLSGLCVQDGNQGLCVNACLLGSNSCVEGFDCVDTDTSLKICWPDASNTDCQDPRVSGAQLNEVCYLENAANGADSWYNPCAPDLGCFYFRPRPEGQVAACVTYCNSSDRPCASGLTCCYGVDAGGNCIETPSQAGQYGGCFNLRQEGESCVLAENSICHDGLGCWIIGGDASTARCFRECPSGQSQCGSASTCNKFYDAGNNPVVDLCCDNAVGQATQGTVCAPSNSSQHREVGSLCNVNEDCDSGLCLRFENTAACSRTCRLGAGTGCPENIDVDGDGINDVGLTCRSVNGEGHCWPDGAPAELVDCSSDPTNPICDDPNTKKIYCANDPSPPECKNTIDPPGGCCAAAGGAGSRGAALVNAMPWLLLLGWRWSRRRRRLD